MRNEIFDVTKFHDCEDALASQAIVRTLPPFQPCHSDGKPFRVSGFIYFEAANALSEQVAEVDTKTGSAPFSAVMILPLMIADLCPLSDPLD